MEDDISRGWWCRPAGGREVFRIATPLILSSLSATLLAFIDRMFITWWSADALAASFPSVMLWWTSVCFPMGVCMYAGTFVAQYHGADQPTRIGPVVWQGLWLSLFAMPLVLPVTLLAPIIFQAAGHGTNVIREEVIYFNALQGGTFPLLASSALAGYFSGRGATRIVFLVDITAALFNAVLDYCWIFGHAGLPATGIFGAGWATSLSFWLKLAIYMVLWMRRDHRATFHTFAWRIDGPQMRKLLEYGVPGGLQIFLDVLGFTCFTLLVGSLGTIELAATNLAFNISTLAFMPVHGISQATSILVGQHMGARRVDLAERASWTAGQVALTYMALVSLLYVCFPSWFLWGFEAGKAAQIDSSVFGLAAMLLRYVAAYNLFDALNLICAGALKGAGDTRFVFLVSILMALALAAGTWVGIHFFGVALHGCWVIVTIWVWLMGVVYLLRFLQGSWRSIRMIE